ncbi:MAG: DUF4935 domain-containing protein [Bacteroidales bacterium]|nr:DUF4935 domain-containing protein [Bacteroidales bacterium]
MEQLHILTPEREKKLWSEAIFVFDTSSICALYNLKANSQKIVADILNKLKNRIWIPAQVKYEYLKNREKVIDNPVNECYNDPQIVKTGRQLVNNFSDFLKDNENNDYHPYIKDDSFHELTKKRDELKKTIEEIIELIKKEKKDRISEIQSIKINDCIKDTFLTLKCGQAFSFNEILGIIQEGEFRYRNTIPPGYMDKDTKQGSQIYGDLIIWKEILRYACQENKSVIFVCDDIKEDWLQKNGKDVEIPRVELIKEFQDTAGTDFWMYTVKKFIDKLELYNRDPSILPLYKGLEGIKFVLEVKELRTRTKSIQREYIIVKCNECGQEIIVEYDDLDFEWEAVSGSERSMGTETEYKSTEYIDCPRCNNQIEIEFHIWEYPAGSLNDDSIEINGGELVSDIYDFSNRICLYDYNENYDFCEKCGKQTVTNGMNLCSECEAEYNDFMERD